MRVLEDVEQSDKFTKWHQFTVKQILKPGNDNT